MTMTMTMTTKGAEVRLDNAAFSYGEMPMLFDIGFAAGAITAIMGPSGSGKSTLLNLVAGFEQLASGRVTIGETDVTRLSPSARPVSMIFQENNLFAHLDVGKNVGLGISPSLTLSEPDRARIAEALRRTGLAGLDRRLPAELSGGERQRVALARVLVRERPVLLLDEPFASLGPALRADMLDLLMDVQRERGMTVLLVTHQPEDARRASSRLVFVEGGAVAASGETEWMFGETGPEAFRAYLGRGDANHGASWGDASAPARKRS